MQASDLGTYLFYDSDGQYFVSDEGPLLRRDELEDYLFRVNRTPGRRVDAAHAGFPTACRRSSRASHRA